MKLKNWKTGEIVVFSDGIIDLNKIGCKNVDEMIMAGWEDYEEPKGYWFLGICGDIFRDCSDDECVNKEREQIGNRFETEDDAKKALEKLKAITRLQNKGFRFDGYDVAHNSNGNLCGQIFYNAGNYCIEDVEKDLDLLFGGEE